MESKRWYVLTGGVTLFIALMVTLYKINFFTYLFPPAGTAGDAGSTRDALQLSGVVLLGLALVVFLMVILAIVYWVLELANKNEALALPAGSVRALIAFSLVLIFVCLGAFLYNSVNSVDVSNGTKLARITEDKLNELRKQFAVVPEPVRDETSGAQLYDPPADKDGKLKAGAQKLYNVTYYSKRSKEADDFAKQIFTTLATVFVSVISFYFGSATSAAKTPPGSSGGAKTPPSITSLNPNPIPQGSSMLKIIGDGLASVTKVKFDTDEVNVKPPDVSNKLVTVTVPATILAKTGQTVKVSVVGDGGESSTTDLKVD